MTPSIPSDINGIASLPAELPGIVILNGLKMCNFKQALYRELLIKFLDSKRSEAGEIRALLTAGDRETAGRKAHSMKSVSGILGAVNLSETARLLEETINNDADELLHTRLESFEDALSIVINGLDAAFGAEMDESGAVPLSGENSFDSQAIIDQLHTIDALLDRDMVQTFELVAKLGTQLCVGDISKHYAQLLNQVHNFDAEAAKNTLSDMLSLLEGNDGQ